MSKAFRSVRPATGNRKLERVWQGQQAKSLLKRLAWYYQVNDCKERLPEDALEVPIRDLKSALQIVLLAGGKPEP